MRESWIQPLQRHFTDSTGTNDGTLHMSSISVPDPSTHLPLRRRSTEVMETEHASLARRNATKRAHGFQPLAPSKPVLRVRIVSSEEHNDSKNTELDLESIGESFLTQLGPSPTSVIDSGTKHGSSTSSALSLDWSFLRRDGFLASSPVGTDCPSLISVSATSSRNSSVKSIKSARVKRWAESGSHTEFLACPSMTSAPRLIESSPDQGVIDTVNHTSYHWGTTSMPDLHPSKTQNSIENRSQNGAYPSPSQPECERVAPPAFANEGQVSSSAHSDAFRSAETPGTDSLLLGVMDRELKSFIPPPDSHRIEKRRAAIDVEKVEALESATAESLRCLSLTSSAGAKSSDDETDWTESSISPQSDTDVIHIWPILSPMKRQIVDQAMKEFHRMYESKLEGTSSSNIRSCSGGSGGSASPGGSSERSSGGSPGNSLPVSRKRSLSRGGSPPTDNNRDDPSKRRRPDETDEAQSVATEKRFACPYYKRNPGRHQTFTSCRDPGFVTVARLKEHLYRRHLLPAQCHRCCMTFASETSLREHQRDIRGCEIREQIPLEGFDKEQERKLKSKKRGQKAQNEEEKWKSVFAILFPDDNPESMPSPYIEYQVPGASQSDQSSSIVRFQAYSRLELPRLVRQTLEIAVEREAQPLGAQLRDQLVDIVRECQTQLFTMFEASEERSNCTEPVSASTTQPRSSVDLGSDSLPELPFHDFDSFPPSYDLSSFPNTDQGVIQPTTFDFKQDFLPTDASGSPDSGYDSSLNLVLAPSNFSGPEQSAYVDDTPLLLDGFYGLFEDRSMSYSGPADPALWSFEESTTHMQSHAQW